MADQNVNHQDMADVNQVGLPPQKFTCFHCCNRQYNDLASIIAHNRSVHKLNMLICAVCSTAFRYTMDLANHVDETGH
ncbi:hypothetical protein HAX54_006922, partial [Datura stramonium]|nr:hypothetical protein [Datura stramonium]